MDSTQVNPKIRLTINQRNLYMYYLNHKKKHKNTPCFVPKMCLQETRRNDYLKAVERLEEYGLIRLDKTGWHYTSWIMLDPV